MTRKKINKFASEHRELWKFVKFNFTVIVTSLLDICVYLVLLYWVFKPLNSQSLPQNELLSFLGIRYKGYLYAYLVSTTAGYAAAYLMNRKFTFHSDIHPAYSSFLYFLLAVFNILFSSWFGSVVGSFMLRYSLSNPFTEIISKFVIINIPTLWTYPIERYIIQIRRGSFRRKANGNCN